jgi:G2/mitotic-specific cyclin 1/2
MRYALQIERHTQPVPFHMEQQQEVSWDMRRILILWLFEVAQEHGLVQETLHLAVNLLDRMVSLSPIYHVYRKHYQLLGTTCLWIGILHPF